MRFFVTKQVADFAYAHQLPAPYEGNCRNLHGHNGIVVVTVGAAVLDVNGMVIDFKVLKNTFGAYVKQQLDHALIWSERNIETAEALPLRANKTFFLPKPTSTAENIAAHLFTVFSAMLESIVLEEDPHGQRGLFLAKVSVQETNGSVAEASI